MTRLLLWEEYRQAHPEGYGYSQFCELFRHWCGKLSISMRQVHKAGEKTFIDYSGLKVDITDPQSGNLSRGDLCGGAGRQRLHLC